MAEASWTHSFSLARAPWQVLILVMWLTILLCGLSVLGGFMGGLSNSVPGPPGSPSLTAHEEYNKAFPSQPVLLSVLVASADGVTPLTNRSAPFELVSHPPFFEHDADTPLSGAAANVSHKLRNISLGIADVCDVTFSSFWDIGPTPNASDSELRRMELEFVDRALAAFGEGRLFNDDATATLMIATVKTCHGELVNMQCPSKKDYCDPIVDVLLRLNDYANSDPDELLMVQVADFPDINLAIRGGISKTLDLSTMSMPFALGVLALMLRNVRLLVCPLLCILCTLTGAILVMYPISLVLDVSSQAPSLMVATSLAMSIDYSLFLLSRFTEEIKHGRTPELAVEIMLGTSGHTVLVSGGTLALCFLGMLIAPIAMIQSMGISAAITTVFALTCALTLTPTLLLLAPRFFTSSRRFGLSLDGCCCGRHPCEPVALAAETLAPAADALLGASLLSSRDAPVSPAVTPATTPALFSTPDSAGSQPAHDGKQAGGGRPGCWARLGKASQRWALPVFVLIVGSAVPFGLAVGQLGYVEGLLPMMPVGDPATNAFVSLQQQFGVGSVFANTLLLKPPAGTNVTDAAWLRAACHALVDIASNVTADLEEQGSIGGKKPYPMGADAFSGLMIQRGKCSGGLVDALAEAAEEFEKLNQSGFAAVAAGAEEALLDMYASPQRDATKVGVTLKENPFAASGQAWVRAMRRAMDAQQAAGLGELYLTGVAPEQMDGAALTFASLPRMVVITLAIVCVVLGLAFRSVVVPIRAVVCLAWMLCVVFGAAVGVYQLGLLQGLDYDPLSPSGGDIFWMSPCIAFAIVVGLGLDYDVFFMEAVVEHYDRGATSRQAVINALAHTGNTICAAGVIMALAFGALLVGNTPALNQIGFLLVVGVLIDCFITTKVFIPCCMALLPEKANLWPRKRPDAVSNKLRVVEPDGAPQGSAAAGEEDEGTATFY